MLAAGARPKDAKINLMDCICLCSEVEIQLKLSCLNSFREAFMEKQKLELKARRSHNLTLSSVSKSLRGLTSTPKAKDQFYEALEETMSGIPSSEGIYLLGDFNARVGPTGKHGPPVSATSASAGSMTTGRGARTLLSPRPLLHQQLL